MKILHTSDWHVGSPCAQYGEAASRVREHRGRAVRRLPEIAVAHEVDLVLVAGDLFDSSFADEDTVSEVVSLLNQFAPLRVVVIPGNHDLYEPGGVWDRRAWDQLGEHVTVALEAEELSLDDRVSVFPCPIKQKQSRLDPTEWIPPRSTDDGRIRIGLAHGSLDALAKVENFPIAQERAEVVGLDYLALGDWHGARVFGSGSTAYCGAPEGLTFGERRAGSALVVEIADTRDAAPRVETVRVGTLRWFQTQATIRDATDLAELESELLGLGRSDHCLARIELQVMEVPPEGEARQASLLAQSGSDDAPLVTLLEASRRKWSDRLLYLDWRMEVLEVGLAGVPRSLETLDEWLLGAIAVAQGGPGQAKSGELSEELIEVMGDDIAVLREARWQLRLLAAETSQ